MAGERAVRAVAMVAQAATVAGAAGAEATEEAEASAVRVATTAQGAHAKVARSRDLAELEAERSSRLRRPVPHHLSQRVASSRAAEAKGQTASLALKC